MERVRVKITADTRFFRYLSKIVGVANSWKSIEKKNWGKLSMTSIRQAVATHLLCAVAERDLSAENTEKKPERCAKSGKDLRR